MTRLIVTFACLSCLVACAEPPAEAPYSASSPNLILIIGDGMDDHQITIARNYLVGNAGRLTLDDMPFRGMVQVQTVDNTNPAVPRYVGDSASGATAMATGQPTAEGRISTAAKTNEHLPTIMEMARAAGMRTGIVTTSRITDATPASFVAHMSNRYCEMPRGMVREEPIIPQDSTDCSAEFIANGGSGSIVEQIVNLDIDIYLGGGAGRFTDFIEGSDSITIRDAAVANSFRIIESGSELMGDLGQGKVLGLFTDGHMPERMRGGVADFIERVNGVPQWPEAFGCEPNPAFGDTPSLAAMTRVALDRLDSHEGFLLVVESASIDKAMHYWRPCGHIGEMEQLDEAVEVSLDYAAVNRSTLVLVTADHGQTAQLLPHTSGLAPQQFAPTGRFARVRTPEDGIMGIGYASNDSPHWEDHTGVQVPLYAAGPRVDGLPHYLLQSDIFHIVATHLGLGDTWPAE